MGTGWQSSAGHEIYQRRVDQALDQLPVLECHCLCLLWRTISPSQIARLIGVSEGEVRAALDRAVSNRRGGVLIGVAATRLLGAAIIG